MRTNLWIIFCAIACAAPAWAQAERTLTEQIPLGALERVTLEGGVGDIEVVTSPEDLITVQVELKPRRGGIFSSLKRAEQEVEHATLEASSTAQTLRLKVHSDSHDRRFEERWYIEMPEHLALEVEQGVGDTTVRGLSGGVRLEAGVGDVAIDVVSGELSVELGVGDVTVSSSAAEYSSAKCSAGVGNAYLRAQGKRSSSEGFVGHSASWEGDGPHTIDIQVGVGDARIILE